MKAADIVNEIEKYVASGGNADYIGLTEALYRINDIMSLVFGVAIVIILAGIPLITSFEVMYITFPILRERVDNIAENKRMGVAGGTLGLVTRDARKAVERSATGENNGNTLLDYLKIKSKAIIISILVVLLIIQVGPIIVQLIMKLALGIIAGFG